VELKIHNIPKFKSMARTRDAWSLEIMIEQLELELFPFEIMIYHMWTFKQNQ